MPPVKHTINKIIIMLIKLLRIINKSSVGSFVGMLWFGYQVCESDK